MQQPLDGWRVLQTRARGRGSRGRCARLWRNTNQRQIGRTIDARRRHLCVKVGQRHAALANEVVAQRAVRRTTLLFSGKRRFSFRERAVDVPRQMRAIERRHEKRHARQIGRQIRCNELVRRPASRVAAGQNRAARARSKAGHRIADAAHAVAQAQQNAFKRLRLHEAIARQQTDFDVAVARERSKK